MTRIPVRTPHAISSHTKPGDIGHLGIDLEPIPSVHANVDPGPHPASGKAPPQIIAPLASPALFVCDLHPGPYLFIESGRPARRPRSSVFPELFRCWLCYNNLSRSFK